MFKTSRPAAFSGALVGVRERERQIKIERDRDRQRQTDRDGDRDRQTDRQSK